MKNLFFAFMVLCCTATHVFAGERVLTLYLMGTGLKADAYDAANTAWGRPELLAFMHYHQDGSQAIVRSQPYLLFTGRWVPEILVSNSHYKYVVNGAGTSPEANVLDLASALLGKADPNLGVRTWENIKLEALDAVNRVRQRHPSDTIILNLVGYSRGGISTMMVARAVSQPGYEFVRKVNILAYDPVPGGSDPVLAFGNSFLLSSKVNQFVGLYAEDERTHQFEPVVPKREPGNYTSKMLMVRVPGSHETLVGNRQEDGHSVLGPLLTRDTEIEGFKYVNEVAQSIAEQLLSSYEWGSVPYYNRSGIVDRSGFSQRVSAMWSQGYGAMTWQNFGLGFSTYDILYGSLGRDHNLRALPLLLIVWPGTPHASRQAFIGGMRHENEWAYTYIWPFWVKINYWNTEQVYWLNNLMPRVDGNTWDVLQSFRGSAPPDTVAPVPNLNPLPDATAACALTITSTPTATDNADGMVVGKTTDPLTYMNQGSYVINWAYADKAGNTSRQTQFVSVRDTEPPVPNQSELPEISGVGSAQISAYPVASDNCAETVTGTTSDPLSYTILGTYTLTWTYADGQGNATTQTQKVRVLPVPGDLNKDGCVDLTDYNEIIGVVRARGTNLVYDLNGDGVVTIADARFLATKFSNPKGAPCN